MASCGAALVSQLRPSHVGALSSARSELAGLSTSFSALSVAAKPVTVAAPRIVVCPTAKRVCDLTGKKRNNGYKVSFSNHRTKHIQLPNLQWKRVWWPRGNRFVRLKLSTKAIKTLEWKPLDTMAKEAGINLNDY
jgi:large subunit ribosomal protein L28